MEAMIDLESTLNPEQQAAVLHREGPLLVLAGAGSGKTRVVTFRIAHLIETGIDPRQILAVTFTNKAAGEMQERVEIFSRGRWTEGRPTICTFHSLGARILRESIPALGYKNDFTIYDEDDSNRLLKSCLQSLGVVKEAAQVKIFKGLISTLKDQLLSPNELETLELTPPLQKLFPQVFKLYQERLKEANALDFDDLLYLTVQLFREHPEILTYYQKRWHFLLIDEYQDTNAAQYHLARLLVEKTHNIFVVGDPDQSIYSWRGANIKNILNFERDYPGAKVVRLEQNYRSRENILNAANALIQYNLSRYEKNLWSKRGSGEKLFLYIASEEREEAGFVVHEMERLHREYKIPRKEMAIFYRTNFQSRTFEDALLRKRIPYVIVGGISFYQRKEIKDILAFLHMVQSNTDFIAFVRTVNLPKRGLGGATLDKIRIHASELKCSLFEYCEKLVREETSLRLTEKQREGLREYVTLIQELRAFIKDNTLSKLLIETVRRTGYLTTLKEDPETYDDRKANVEELIAKAAEWEMLHDSSSLTEFLEELTLKTSLDEAEMSDDKINLMTIHNGKGLEFTVAFLVGMEEDLFPHANSRDRYDALEEERRLCYVGMTRAKELLYITAAESRFIWGSFRTMRPSRFLREIPKEYLERLK